MHRTISPLGLLFISISAILGSGWLFGSFYAAQNAGPASLLSWVIAGIFVIIIAFTFAEICSLVPVSGSSVRLPQFTHGKVVGVFCSLNTWFCYVTLTVIEVFAVMQYLSFYYPSLIYSKGGLTTTGHITADILLFLLSFINTYSVKWIVKFNTSLTMIKIIVPLFIGFLLLALHFSISKGFNFSFIIHPVGSTFAPFGIHGIFAAISVGGVVFSYNAFKQAAEMAGEAKNPNFSVPFAIVGSVIICMFIFIVLQSSFLSSLEPGDLRNGWTQIALSNNQSPFVSLLSEHGINWAIPILYFAAIISPMAAALVYCTGAARSLYGIAANGYAPKILLKLNKREESSLAVWINFILAMIIFHCFKNWEQVADFLTCLFAISYGLAPVCMIAMRVKLPLAKRPLKLPFGYIWAYTAFFVTTLFIYWVGWETISKVTWFFVFALIVILIFQKVTNNSFYDFKEDWKSSIWLWTYLVVIIIVSLLGNYGKGLSVLTGIYSIAFIAIASAIVLTLAGKFSLSAEKIKQQIDTGLASDNK